MLTVASGYARYRLPDSIKPCLPILVLVSILWTAWDPTYGGLKRAQYQGRVVRQRGKKEYNVKSSLDYTCLSLMGVHSGPADGCVALQSRDLTAACPFLVKARVGPIATMGRL